MSFSQTVKKEILAQAIAAPCCVAAACYGIACFGKYFDTRGLILHTENAQVALWAKAMYKQAGIDGKVYVKSKSAHIYEFAVKDPFEVEKMLAMFDHTGEETALRIGHGNLSCGGCFSAFVAAAFLSCGTIVNPQKGYMLEFVSARYSLMRDFEALLQSHGFAPKYTTRNGANVLYFKASEQIEDLLTLMGAGASALEIMQLKVYRDLRNRANRITNCETANIDKTVAANREVLEAIQYLAGQGALETLPEPLQEAARLRRAHPDLSLAELAAASLQPVSKSGLNHRLRKLKDMAETLKERQSAKPASAR
ncbi:MAG: DNA-binding protein WhiA [Ruminococcaceae bacterium]|nr:DNA-binding protein WhiA [Oscillospiraceae bacterium]